MTKKITLTQTESNSFYNRFELDELNPYSFCIDNRIYHLYTCNDKLNNHLIIGSKETLFEFLRNEIQYMNICNDDMDAYLKAIRLVRNLDVENSRYITIELEINEYETYVNCFIYLVNTNYDDEWL